MPNVDSLTASNDVGTAWCCCVVILDVVNAVTTARGIAKTIVETLSAIIFDLHVLRLDSVCGTAVGHGGPSVHSATRENRIDKKKRIEGSDILQ